MGRETFLTVQAAVQCALQAGNALHDREFSSADVDAVRPHRNETVASAFLRHNGWRDALHLRRPFLDPRRLRQDFLRVALRSAHIKHFGFAILDAPTVEFLLRYSPMVEIGAGSGYWSYELSRAGADVVATDLAPSCYTWARSWTKVHKLSASAAVSKFPRRTLLTVWPEYHGRWAAAALRRHAATGGSTVVYVGENGGCTADETFHRMLRDGYMLVDERRIPQFPGIHDQLEVWAKKESKR